MDDTKKWWQSKTVVASAISIAAAIAGFFGLPDDVGMQAVLTDSVLQFISVAMGVLAIFGRITATSKIG